jgi:hypothetical protein
LPHQLAAHGEVKDHLAQLTNLIRARREGGEVVEREASIVAEGFGIGLVEAGEARCGQPIARRLALRLRRLQPIAERHQLIDLGDNAVLLSDRREGKVDRG